MSYSRSDAHDLRAQLNKMLVPLGKSFKGQVHVMGISYGGKLCAKIEIHPVDKEGVDISAKREFEEYVTLYPAKVQAEHFGRSFRAQNGEVLTIIGVNPRSARYPFRVTNKMTGKVYRVSENYIESMLAHPVEVKKFNVKKGMHVGHLWKDGVVYSGRIIAVKGKSATIRFALDGVEATYPIDSFVKL
jgi:hypothetical protein